MGEGAWSSCFCFAGIEICDAELHLIHISSADFRYQFQIGSSNQISLMLLSSW